MTYQTITGTLSGGAHPGSYNGQDAYNDMLVVDDEESMVHRKRAARPVETGGYADRWIACMTKRQ